MPTGVVNEAGYTLSFNVRLFDPRKRTPQRIAADRYLANRYK